MPNSHNSMMEKLREIDQNDKETAEKLRRAARTILTQAVERIGTDQEGD